jgi:uncharacterized membrane protein YkvA (DUF1232 family)
MFCTECGTRIASDAKFCQRCGAPTRRDDDNDSRRPRRDDEETGDRGRRERGTGGFGNARRRAEDYVRDPQRTQELLAMALSKANSRRGAQGVVDEIWEYLQVAARLIQATVRGEYTGLSGKSLMLIVAAIIYFVSPIDIIPDFLPIAGLLDEMTVLAFVLRSVRGEIDAFKEWEAQQDRS